MQYIILWFKIKAFGDVSQSLISGPFFFDTIMNYLMACLEYVDD